jgi:hypothetical protein
LGEAALGVGSSEILKSAELSSVSTPIFFLSILFASGGVGAGFFSEKQASGPKPTLSTILLSKPSVILS